MKRCSMLLVLLVLSLLLALTLVVYAADQQLSIGDWRVGSFNVQVFGVKKMEDPAVVSVLVSILSRYDICLIQEIRDAGGQSIHQLVAKLNEATGKSYTVILSERLGRTSSKEEYAYIYDPTKIVVEKTYQYPVEYDQFERAPFSILVHSKAHVEQRWFFTGVHVSPSVAPVEINHLYDVYQYHARDEELGVIMQDSWLLMGDLNADCTYMRKADWANNTFAQKSDQFKYLISTGEATTFSVSNCAYDRFVTTRTSLTPSNANTTIFKFHSAYNLTLEFAKKVSDHFPIELTIYDSSSPSSRVISSGNSVIVFAMFILLLAVGQ